jgi:hypothetical protein
LPRSWRKLLLLQSRILTGGFDQQLGTAANFGHGTQHESSGCAMGLTAIKFIKKHLVVSFVANCIHHLSLYSFFWVQSCSKTTELITTLHQKKSKFHEISMFMSIHGVFKHRSITFAWQCAGVKGCHLGPQYNRWIGLGSPLVRPA